MNAQTTGGPEHGSHEVRRPVEPALNTLLVPGPHELFNNQVGVARPGSGRTSEDPGSVLAKNPPVRGWPCGFLVQCLLP